jgi:hypothetical protein
VGRYTQVKSAYPAVHDPREATNYLTPQPTTKSPLSGEEHQLLGDNRSKHVI